MLIAATLIIIISTLLATVTFWLRTSFVITTVYEHGHEKRTSIPIWPFLLIPSYAAALYVFLNDLR